MASDDTLDEEMSIPIAILHRFNVKEITKLLTNTADCSCFSKKYTILCKIYAEVEKSQSECTVLHHNSHAEIVDFMLAIQRVIQSSAPSTFVNRDYFSYSYEDFDGLPAVYETFLQILNIIFKSALSEVHTVENASDERDDKLRYRYLQLLMTDGGILLDLLILIGANDYNALWSADSASKLCNDLLNCLLNLFSVENVNGLFEIEIETFQNKHAKKMPALLIFIDQYKQYLVKEEWGRNPYVCKVFCWFINQSKFPLRSDCIDFIVATSLNFILDHQESNKIQGIKTVHHMLQNVSGEEMRWYNRINVVYEALYQQLCTKDSLVMCEVLQALITSVGILDKGPSRDHHSSLLETLLRTADMENLIALRKLYMSNIEQLIQKTGFACAGKLKLILNVIVNYSEVEDGSHDHCRLKTLDALIAVMKVAWPRIPAHRDTILKTVFKLLVDIQTPYYQETHNEETQSLMKEKIDMVLKMLNKLCPKVADCCQAVKESNIVSDLIWT